MQLLMGNVLLIGGYRNNWPVPLLFIVFAELHCGIALMVSPPTSNTLLFPPLTPAPLATELFQSPLIQTPPPICLPFLKLRSCRGLVPSCVPCQCLSASCPITPSQPRHPILSQSSRFQPHPNHPLRLLMPAPSLSPLLSSPLLTP